MIVLSEYIAIPKNYSLTGDGGFYSVLEKDFETKLNAFLEKHSIIQQKENYTALPLKYLENFPFVDFEPYKDEIFSRKQEIKFLEKLIEPYFFCHKSLLEIGGWNCWLTKWLQSKGLEIISTDIFKDAINGLSSKQFHKNNDWLSVQLDITNPEIYIKKFDVIIINHSLQFLTNPEEITFKYKNLLAKGGILIILGMNFFSKTKAQEKKVIRYRKFYIDKYNFNIHFYPCKGYFDNAFFEFLIKQKFNFKSYKFSFLGNIKKKLKAEKSGIMYLINH
jgi:2-polyprenyl-3-methyl-5-hydroxy-6-metoxy-1,4-benzoquinol methylase